MEQAKKNIMESLGFQFEGDYKEIVKNMGKLSKLKYPVFESKHENNQPGNPLYGKNESGEEGLITLREAFHLYDENLNKITDIFNLNKDYLQDEEIAFKNALLLYSNDYYRISYKVKNHLHEEIQTHYFSTNFDQKPLTNYLFPIMENLFLNDKDSISKRRRYHFSFLF
jgi:hypothetical protein